MPAIPRDEVIDSAMDFIYDGYNFIAKRCRRFQSDIFLTRLMLQKTVCITGKEWARVFYEEEGLQRRKAVPARLLETLSGRGGVQGMDGAAHRHRKEMIMSLMTPEKIKRLADLTAEQWHIFIAKWEESDRIVLLHEVHELLCRAVCRWTGVALNESEVDRRTADLAAMVDASGAVGPRHWRGRRARNRSERWLADSIGRVRRHRLEPESEQALAFIARHRDLNGRLLDRHTAAVELINVLQPTVAIARYVVFAAAALHQFPQIRLKVQTGGEEDVERFVQEVRRFFPFFPSAAARVERAFTARGYRFPQGARVLLDLYGTNHDAHIWDGPERFDPERFRRWDGNAFNFIPQGGGDHYQGHRCAGEWITIALMKTAVHSLLSDMRYDVPEQNLRIRLSRVPAEPESGFIIANIRRSRAVVGEVAGRQQAGIY